MYTFTCKEMKQISEATHGFSQVRADYLLEMDSQFKSK